jgi:PII-like signaling protein
MRFEKKKCLMIFIEDTDTWKGERLHQVIIRLMHKRGLDGATAFSGITGFGSAGQIHRKGLFGVSDEKPIVIVAVDAEAKIMDAVATVAPFVKEGLICTYDTEVFIPDESPGNPK